MRAKILEVGHQFSDWDRAAIIWNSDIPLLEKHEEIQRSADVTSDSELRKQILERIAYDQDALRILMNRLDIGQRAEVFTYCQIFTLMIVIVN